jgi:hypothetical protein
VTVIRLNRKAEAVMTRLPASLSIASAAPNAAPAVAPRISGAAIGFWKMPWYDAPAAERQPPTRQASSIRGSRTLNTMLTIWSVQDWWMGNILERTIPNSSPGVMGKRPRKKEKTMAAKSRMPKPVMMTGYGIGFFALPAVINAHPPQHPSVWPIYHIIYNG